MGAFVFLLFFIHDVCMPGMLTRPGVSRPGLRPKASKPRPRPEVSRPRPRPRPEIKAKVEFNYSYGL